MTEPKMQVIEPERSRGEIPGSPRAKIGRDGKCMILILGGSFLMGTNEAEVHENLTKFLRRNDEAEAKEIQRKVLMGTSKAEAWEFQREYRWTREWLEREMPQHWVYLASFHIAETPVTNEEYKRFLDANPLHRAPGNWDKIWRTFPAGKDKHPVVDVDWQDANDYARWVGGRLPTEAEWEKAASWDNVKREKRRFPWGNKFDEKKCNTWDSGIKDTIPVGRSEGPSPYLVLDMTGNIWEWTSSVWGKNPDEPDFNYPYRADDGRENLNLSDVLHVLRGGSWLSDPILARCAFRFRSHPCDRNINIGFRVAESAL